MFKNSYQSGLLSIFYSCGANPLGIWDMEVNNGHIKRLTDAEVNSIVLEIVSTNVATTYISCPRNNQYLGIKLPFLVMIVKNLKRYFSFEIMILDDKNMRRRFRISNFQSTTKIKPFCTTMPIGLSGGWNQIQFNLADFTRRAYGTQFIEALRVQVHANVRLRRIYFAERLYPEEELPQDYKLYLPLEKKLKKEKGKKEDKKVEAKASVARPAASALAPAPEPEAEADAKGEELQAENPPKKAPSTVPESATPAETPKETPAGTETPAETPADAGTPAAETPADAGTPAAETPVEEAVAPPEGAEDAAESKAPTPEPPESAEPPADQAEE